MGDHNRGAGTIATLLTSVTMGTCLFSYPATADQLTPKKGAQPSLTIVVCSDSPQSYLPGLRAIAAQFAPAKQFTVLDGSVVAGEIKPDEATFAYLGHPPSGGMATACLHQYPVFEQYVEEESEDEPRTRSAYGVLPGARPDTTIRFPVESVSKWNDPWAPYQRFHVGFCFRADITCARDLLPSVFAITAPVCRSSNICGPVPF